MWGEKTVLVGGEGHNSSVLREETQSGKFPVCVCVYVNMASIWKSECLCLMLVGLKGDFRREYVITDRSSQTRWSWPALSFCSASVVSWWTRHQPKVGFRLGSSHSGITVVMMTGMFMKIHFPSCIVNKVGSCCRKTFSMRIPLRMLGSYYVQDIAMCPIKAVV